MDNAPLTREDITRMVLKEIVAGELTIVSKADLARRFEGHGPSRATAYRAIDDALAEAAGRGIEVKMAPFQNQWSKPKGGQATEDGDPIQPEGRRPHPTSAEALEQWRDLDWAGVRVAVADIGAALHANRRGSPALADGITKLRRVLGGSDSSATRIVDLVLSVLRPEPSATTGLIRILERIGG